MRKPKTASPVSRERSKSNLATESTFPQAHVQGLRRREVTSRFPGDLGFVAISAPTRAATRKTCTGRTAGIISARGDRPGMPWSISEHVTTFTGGSNFSSGINNLFDRRYYSGAQLGPTGFTATGSYIARPFPAISGEFPVPASDILRAWRTEGCMGRNPVSVLKAGHGDLATLRFCRMVPKPTWTRENDGKLSVVNAVKHVQTGERPWGVLVLPR